MDSTRSTTRSGPAAARDAARNSPRWAVVDPAPFVVVTGVIVAVLSAVAALIGLLWPAEPDVVSVTSVHGESVDLYGEGLYRHDSVFKGAGFRGADVVTVAAVPLLLWSLAAYRRASLRAALISSALLTWFAYVFASVALGAVYNELFLVYVATLATSGIALLGDRSRGASTRLRSSAIPAQIVRTNRRRTEGCWCRRGT